jgi:hypothetical protein
MEKPVTRPTINATMTITERSNGENFIVGKSIHKKKTRTSRDAKEHTG